MNFSVNFINYSHSLRLFWSSSKCLKIYGAEAIFMFFHLLLRRGIWLNTGAQWHQYIKDSANPLPGIANLCDYLVQMTKPSKNKERVSCYSLQVFVESESELKAREQIKPTHSVKERFMMICFQYHSWFKKIEIEGHNWERS